MDSLQQPAAWRRSGRPVANAARGAVSLLLACHPGPVAIVTLLSGGLAVAAGADGPGTVRVAAAVLAGQLSVGWGNDAVDARRDRAAGRRGKPVAAGAVSARGVGLAAAVALCLCVPLSLACGVRAGLIHLLGVAAGWAYNLGVKATALSWLPYAAGFGVLPAFAALAAPAGAWPGWWAVTAAALLGVAAHLGNVLPDIPADLATGVRGWPQRLGPAAARLLLPAPLVAATAVLALGRPGPGALAALALAVPVSFAGVVAGRRHDGAPFAAAVVVAGADVMLLLGRGTSLG
ncbi:UbiA family prenyltransferase [Streptomyces sp. 7-21]|uniref:UbiA family prenyltransferase n=1 Tax=Streptomyces sp. 7-21 TaxID=2802283 RepID=UPI0035A873AE